MLCQLLTKIVGSLLKYKESLIGMIRKLNTESLNTMYFYTIYIRLLDKSYPHVHTMSMSSDIIVSHHISLSHMPLHYPKQK